MTSMAVRILWKDLKRAKTTTSHLEYQKEKVTILRCTTILECMMTSFPKRCRNSQELPEELHNIIINGDSRKLPIPDNCVHLVVTSPPYNASKAYDEDLSLTEYLGLLHEVFSECYRILAPGGRMVVNVANLGRKPYIPLASHINLIMHEIGFMHRGEVIWDKSASAGSSCAWGSFQSASNPCLRDIHEYMLMFSKGDYKLPRTKSERAEGRIDTIGRDEFIQQTKSIWSFSTESARRVNHPAPFPVELPKRCIEMFTFLGMLYSTLPWFWNNSGCSQTGW